MFMNNWTIGFFLILFDSYISLLHPNTFTFRLVNQYRSARKKEQVLHLIYQFPVDIKRTQKASPFPVELPLGRAAYELHLNHTIEWTIFLKARPTALLSFFQYWLPLDMHNCFLFDNNILPSWFCLAHGLLPTKSFSISRP